MFRSFGTKCIAILLSLSLVVGQGAFSTAAAMPAWQMGRVAMSEISDNHIVTSSHDMRHEKDCCSHSKNSNDMMNGTCGACCAAACQMASLPILFAAPVYYPVSQTYNRTNSPVIGRDVLPEPPYPKI
jgi:hypothetical protein